MQITVGVTGGHIPLFGPLEASIVYTDSLRSESPEPIIRPLSRDMPQWEGIPLEWMSGLEIARD
jgi:hypothetical protein